jgi:DNA-directed RNA polymerase subunit K/omega
MATLGNNLNIDPDSDIINNKIENPDLADVADVAEEKNLTYKSYSIDDIDKEAGIDSQEDDSEEDVDDSEEEEEEEEDDSEEEEEEDDSEEDDSEEDEEDDKLEEESEDEEESESEDEEYLKKFDDDVRKNFIVDYHPEDIIHNQEEILSLSHIVRDKDGNIIDELHKTTPFLSRYEKTKIIGQRAKQINSGSKPFIKINQNIIDGTLIAHMELEHKKIPFIIRRPIPNGGSEYWRVKDLELLV